MSFAVLQVLGLFVPKIIENVEKCPFIFYTVHSVCALVHPEEGISLTPWHWMLAVLCPSGIVVAHAGGTS
jgi:hypothetical protein